MIPTKLYFVWIANLGDRSAATKVLAMNPEQAAELFMERYEQRQAEFRVGAGDEDRLVCVEDEDHAVTLTKVSGEMRAVYSAVTMGIE